MSAQPFIQTDLIIIGGGVAGLWTLAQAQQAGYNAILFESNTLGGKQTLASQGIIHGGLKYALSSSISSATEAIQSMPRRWQAALNGNGPVSLSKTKKLSAAHYFVLTQSIESRLISFLGSKLADSYSTKVNTNTLAVDYQQITQSPYLYALNEFVIDTQSLLKDLSSQLEERLFQHHFDANLLTLSPHGDYQYQTNSFSLQTKSVLFANGEGFHSTQYHSAQKQNRPLHMVMMKSASLPYIFAHFIGKGTKPQLTVTSYRDETGTTWYLGGQLAEAGINRTEAKQIDATRQLLKKLLPQLSLDSCRFATLMINRAEAKQTKLIKPDEAYVKAEQNCLVAWPTKLAFAPQLGDSVLQQLPQPSTKPNDLSSLRQTLSLPAVGEYPWSAL